MTITALGLSRGNSARISCCGASTFTCQRRWYAAAVEIPQPGERGAAEVAGIVDQQVDRAALHGGGNECRPVRWVGDVTRHSPYLRERCQLVGDTLQRLRAPGVERQGPVLLGQLDGQGAAQPGGGARDHCMRHAPLLNLK